MDTISLIALLLALATLFGIINAVTLRLPMTIGVLVFSLLTSFFIIALNSFIPAYDLQILPRSVLGSINLPRTLLNGALSLLLFAGAMQVNSQMLRERLTSIAALAVLGTVLAVALLALGVWAMLPLLGLHPPLSWCLVMGAILAPTDPVSVVAMLRRLGLPRPLQTLFAGESLFNDGVAVVLFGAALSLATGTTSHVSPSDIVLIFVREAAGGVLLGGATSWGALRLLRVTRDPHIAILMSLTLATGTFALANHFGMSGAIAVVVAGMVMGSHATMSRAARRELDSAWSLIDEILNVLLFLLIGLELLEITPHAQMMLATLLVIPLSIAARGLSVVLAILPAHLRSTDGGRSLAILTWGGLRGGISVALALGLPGGPLRELLLPVCYGVVVFTIIVQGLTMERLAARLYPPRAAP